MPSSSDLHQAPAGRGCCERRRGERGADRGERVTLLRRRGPHHRVLERYELLEGLGRGHASYERRGPRPALGVDAVAREAGVSEERRDRHVRDRERAEEEAVGGDLRLEVVEYVRDVLLEGAIEDLLVRRYAPHEGVDHHLVEESPDE